MGVRGREEGSVCALIHSILYEADVPMSPILSLFEEDMGSEWSDRLSKQTGNSTSDVISWVF